jgi:diaminopimelate decarboxylase
VGESVLSAVAAAVGTPVYLYDAETIRHRWQALANALRDVPHHVHYSVKANSTLGILRLLRDLGAGADIVSGGELMRARCAGFEAADIVFSGVGKGRDEIERAVEAGIGLINLESFGELELVADVAAAHDRTAQVGIRVNPDVTAETHPYTQTGGAGMKFGVPLDRVRDLAQRIEQAPNVRLTCVGMHIGSQVGSAESYRAGCERLAGLVHQLREDGIASIAAVDIGGGMAIPYAEGPTFDWSAFARHAAALHQSTGLPLLLEPGRSLVGAAGVLLTRVRFQKHSGGKEFLIVDAGMNDLIRPSYYQAHHRIEVVEPGDETHAGAFDVVGPICETGDFLGRDRDLPGAGPGALLAVRDVGAYGFSMSSTYNSRPRPAEVLVDGGRWGVVRRRETLDDLIRGETADPAWQSVPE